jgi:hypothetical protein
MRPSRLLAVVVLLLAAYPAVALSFPVSGLLQDTTPKGPPADPKQGKDPKKDPKKDVQKDDKEPAFDEAAMDEKLLRDAKLTVDGPALLKYFRDRTYKEPDPKKVAQLISELGDKDFPVREKAYSDLLTLGPPVLGALKEAINSKDEEVSKRAAELRVRIEERADPVIQAATARLIGHRKPEGAAEVLLLYLPFAADDNVIDDICKALGKVAVVNGKVEPALVEALKDKLSVKRAAAGAAVVAAEAKDLLPQAQALLKDPAPEVRLRVAVALVSNRHKDAVPALIATFKDLPPEKTWPAEELLLRIATEKDPPQVSLGTDEASRQKCFEEWDKWWAKHGGDIDLAKIDFSNTTLGYTLVVYQNQPMAGKPFKAGSWVVEYDAAKNVRWKFEVPNYCMDATVLGPDKVLCVERNNQKITIRDFKGNVKWEKNVGGNVLSAQKLSNGNTFVVTQNSLIEYDANFKEVFTHVRNNFDVYRGKKLRSGDAIFITNQGIVFKVDKNKNETQIFNCGFLGNIYGSLEELPNGNLLIPLYQQSKVAEYDVKGKEVWAAQVQFPTSAQRLPNGNTLIGSQQQRKVIELDRNGREVWSLNVDGPIFTAKRR